jgi:CDP-diacylglycerol--glycerol-3-phosphate 3-phosphatidyltransferase
MLVVLNIEGFLTQKQQRCLQGLSVICYIKSTLCSLSDQFSLPSTMKSQIPNILTFSRGGLTLLLVILFFFDFPFQYLFLLLVFLLASFTDYLDGYLARKWKVESDVGIVFDSLFDKILILSVFFLLARFEDFSAEIFLLLFLREIFVDGVKNYLLSKNSPTSALYSGKLKMVCEIILIVFCLLYLAYPLSFFWNGYLIFAILSIIFAYWSAFWYTKMFIDALKKS